MQLITLKMAKSHFTFKVACYDIVNAGMAPNVNRDIVHVIGCICLNSAIPR